MKTNQILLVLFLFAAGAATAQPSVTNATVTNLDDTMPSQLPHQNSSNSVSTNNLGFVPDQPASFENLKTAAENGDAKAQFHLGELFFLGQTEVDGKRMRQPIDKNEAVKWYTKAANQNYDIASLHLAILFGLDHKYTEALKWNQKAAEAGYLSAMEAIGVMYENGQGVSKDYVEAVHWYRMAAEQGEYSSQYDLGMMYEQGQGVTKDYVEAYKWYNLAAGNPDYLEIQSIFRDNPLPNSDRGQIGKIERSLNALESRMTPEQIAEAQKMSREFKPGVPASEKSVSQNRLKCSGSGFFITDDGYLISNFHVVKGATKVRLLTSAGTIDAKVVQTDAANDIALLKAEGRFASLPLAASRTVGLGDTVFTLGFPDPSLQGFAPKLAKGEIASLSGAADDARYFQVSVPVQPGNSGGALVDGRGNVVGIVSAKLNASAALAMSGSLPENVNYAVKSSFLLGFLESVPAAKLKSPNTTDEKFSDAVKSAKDATVLVLVY